MPRGPDLSPNEVAMVHSKIKQFLDHEKAQIKHGGMKQILKSCKISGIPISRATVKQQNCGGTESSRARIGPDF